MDKKPFPKPSDKELQEMKAKLRDVFTCPICGQSKFHSRLYGYRCNNPEHAEIEHELERKAIDRKISR